MLEIWDVEYGLYWKPEVHDDNISAFYIEALVNDEDPLPLREFLTQ